MTEKGTNSTGIKAKGGKILIAAGAIIIVLLLTVVYLLISNNSGTNGAPKEKRNVVVNESNAEKAVSEMVEEEPVSGGYYEVTMNSQWTFPDGKSESENAYVENVETNTNDVYFDINRSDTNELVYSSPILPRGTSLENIKLDTELGAGEYDCILTYHLVDEEQNSLSTLKISLKIIVEA